MFWRKVADLTKCNSSVTHSCNSLPRLSKSVEKFLRRCKKFNEDQREPFCFLDFPELSHSNFRQKIKRGRPFIEVVTKGHPTFYKVKGAKLPLDPSRLTLEPMGVSPKLMEILESLKDQPPMIHDIKIGVQAKIHEMLVKKGCSVHPKNHGIVINEIPSFDNNLTIKILVYPNSLQIDIGCSARPLVYDIGSLLLLHEHLARVSFYLTQLTGVLLEPVKDWVISQYHFNKDGSFGADKRDFLLTVEEVSSGLIRFYSKNINGKEIARLEQIRSPQRTIPEEMLKIMGNE